MTWPVRPHDPIEKLEDNLWVVSGDAPQMPFNRRMAVIKLASGELVIHSAIAMDDASMAELEAWGKPAYLIVPNPFHRLDAPAFVARYPDIVVIAPARSRARIEKVVSVAGGFERLPEDDGLTLEVLDGGKVDEAVLLVTSGGRLSLIFNDAVFNVTRPTRGGLKTMILKLIGTIGGPRVTAIGKMALVADKRAFADHLRALAARDDLARVIPAHGEIIDENASDVLVAVADRLCPA